MKFDRKGNRAYKHNLVRRWNKVFKGFDFWTLDNIGHKGSLYSRQVQVWPCSCFELDLEWAKRFGYSEK